MNKIRKAPVELDCPIEISEELITVNDDNARTALIRADTDISEFVQSSKNIIDANSDDENEMNNAVLVPTSSEKRNAMKNCSTVSTEELIAVDDHNVCTSPIMRDKDILEFVQSSKNIIDADSDDEDEINNEAPAPTSFEMRKHHANDEAHFWLNGYVNKQNCRIWSEANPQVYVETPLHPEKLTVWCALWANGILLQKR
ncbi:hypothetical protein TNCV_1830091 [Trichonephila clavipes]|nr:hypothetical protein TNCV_1830091 [Trichonephila clavipes]